VLSYSFFRQADNTIQRNRESKIQTVIKDIEEQVPGVKFNLVNNDSEAVIRIAFNHEHPYGKTWSRVGREAERVSFNEPTMNLSDVKHESGDIGNDSKEYSVIMHEFFHALGMLHEHQQPERKFTISATCMCNFDLYHNMELMELTAVGSDMEDDAWFEDINGDIVQHNPTTIAYSRPDIAICMT